MHNGVWERKQQTKNAVTSSCAVFNIYLDKSYMSPFSRTGGHKLRAHVFVVPYVDNFGLFFPSAASLGSRVLILCFLRRVFAAAFSRGMILSSLIALDGI